MLLRRLGGTYRIRTGRRRGYGAVKTSLVRCCVLQIGLGLVLVFKTSRYAFPPHAAHTHEHGITLHVAAYYGHG